MAIWQYLFLFISVLAGGGIAQWLSTRSVRAGEVVKTKGLPLLLSFSGAYLLGIAAMELMPTVFRDSASHTGAWVIGGFILQLVLESFSQGVEHGHVHAHHDAGSGYALSIMFGLGLHAFMEGLPLGAVSDVAGHAHAHAGGGHLLWGIVLHKIPAAFALALLLRASGFTPVFTWLCLLGFACLSPLGAWVGAFLSMDPVWTNRILALVIGGFLHISTTIIFEADGGRSHGISVPKMTVVLAGVLVAYFTAH
ncbi:ZIP family metal transporter [Neolewinella antarctica]|uniref:Zinc transporter ZupT n=1 Tax=Neolewinella antarctica TaxID=442734 RepID=A0ABX0X6K6_9BACT|nr:ZIP family metal transporter [Neolewinella antarctica]NJC24644.1 zinc transporter ZupT [Neolewinella antarctica]